MPLPDPQNPRAAFSTVSAVKPEEPASWDGRTFLTFDIDWAHDDVIHHAIDMVEAAGAPATWFVTHDSPVLERLRANELFELGIHPNFLPLLMRGDPAQGATAEEVVDRLLAIVPEAKSVRSHSLVSSGRLLQIFQKRGLTHDANAFLPCWGGGPLRPWADWFGMIRVPYQFEDDFWFENTDVSIAGLLPKQAGICGYDFHPIHVFLNSEATDRYEAARADFGNPQALRLRRNAERFGAADMLKAVLDAGAC